MPERDPHERSHSFAEVNLGYGHAAALREAERCIQCIKPTCIDGCPVSIDIPRFIRHLLVRDLDEAVKTIHESSIFPSVCGRVCPQESQCEAQCVLIKAKMEPVAIGRLERFVGDHAHAAPAVPPKFDRVLGQVAIVGSGPGGLAAAADLVKMGAEVTVYEALHVVGGVLRYGIPSFRLPREIIDREVNRLRDIGVRFETNKVIGKTFSIAKLTGSMGFDAVFVAAGAGAPSFLGIPGENAGQVYSANEFLTRVNLMGGDQFPYRDTPIGLGDKRGRDRRRQHRDGLPARGQARRRGRSALCLPPLRSRSPGARRGTAPRQGGRHRLPLPARARSRSCIDDDGDVRGDQGPEDDARRARRQRGAASRCRSTSSSNWPCDTVIYALGTKANPIVSQVDPGSGAEQVGLHRRRRCDPGHQPAGRVCRRRHRHRRRHRDPGHGRGPPRSARDRRLPAGRVRATGRSRPRRSSPSCPDPERRTGPPLRSRAMLCPKCHRPLEDDSDGVYICCAARHPALALHRLRQGQRGLRLPLRHMPPVRRQARGVRGRGDARRSATASTPCAWPSRSSSAASAFYQRAAADTGDPVLRELFGRFAVMEGEHMETLCAPLPRRRARRRRPTSASSCAAIFADVENRPAGSGQPVPDRDRAASSGPPTFFASRAELAAPASAEQQLFLELAAEEREHADLLSAEYARWQAGAAGAVQRRPPGRADPAVGRAGRRRGNDQRCRGPARRARSGAHRAGAAAHAR